ncbi:MULTISPECIES: hypothetical protein [Robertmurraya]|uniref:Uncharacterized protein n=1 Tax=Robertmurraya beringensis TaxID=641660 RepID=A0ABV6KVQ9_9BACI
MRYFLIYLAKLISFVSIDSRYNGRLIKKITAVTSPLRTEMELTAVWFGVGT